MHAHAPAVIAVDITTPALPVLCHLFLWLDFKMASMCSHHLQHVEMHFAKQEGRLSG